MSDAVDHAGQSAHRRGSPRTGWIVAGLAGAVVAAAATWWRLTGAAPVSTPVSAPPRAEPGAVQHPDVQAFFAATATARPAQGPHKTTEGCAGCGGTKTEPGAADSGPTQFAQREDWLTQVTGWAAGTPPALGEPRPMAWQGAGARWRLRVVAGPPVHHVACIATRGADGWMLSGANWQSAWPLSGDASVPEMVRGHAADIADVLACLSACATAAPMTAGWRWVGTDVDGAQIVAPPTAVDAPAIRVHTNASGRITRMLRVTVSQQQAVRVLALPEDP